MIARAYSSIILFCSIFLVSAWRAIPAEMIAWSCRVGLANRAPQEQASRSIGSCHVA
jgi:hypothetical protein